MIQIYFKSNALKKFYGPYEDMPKAVWRSELVEDESFEDIHMLNGASAHPTVSLPWEAALHSMLAKLKLQVLKFPITMLKTV